MNKGLPVAGYQDQSNDRVETVNTNKILEEQLLRCAEAIRGNPDYDPRFAQIAITHFQEGFMALNRAVFQPGRISLPGDPE